MSDGLQGEFDLSPLDALRKQARQPISRCPCCGGATKLYRRKFNSGMARCIIALWRYTPKLSPKWLRLAALEPRLVAQVQGDLSKLALWGLAESRPENGTAKRDSGQWRITALGSRFATRLTTIPSHVFLRSPGNNITGWEDTHCDVIAALGKHFDYAKLMRGED
jgi:hypothetical protein